MILGKEVLQKPKVTEQFDDLDDESDLSYSDADDEWDDIDNFNTTIASEPNETPIKKERKKRKNRSKRKLADASISDSESETSTEDEDEKERKGFSGHANVFSSILNTKKNVSGANVILLKAKKESKKNKKKKVKKEGIEVVQDGKIVVLSASESDSEDDLPKAKTLSDKDAEVQRRLWENLYRVKPDIVDDREKEKRLRTIATKGVVQLFTAFEKHNRDMKKKLSETKSELQKEKILTTAGKDAFLEVLWNEGKKVDATSEEQTIKTEPKIKLENKREVNKSKWKVFADEFYDEPNLKNWDKNNFEED